MREPSIKLLLRGPADRYGRQRLYLRYSFNYSTNYISLPWKFDPKDWDEQKQLVRSKAVLSGEGAANVNRALRQKLAEAFNVTASMLAEDVLPEFERFRRAFLGDRAAKRPFHELGEEVIAADFAAQRISDGTRQAYQAALKKWSTLAGRVIFANLTKSLVSNFQVRVAETHNENLAAQYVRNCKAVYRRILQAYDLQDKSGAFDGLDLKVKRISEKKTLTVSEYNQFYAALEKTDPTSVEFETLRRFLLMCRGVRFSDTVAIRRDKHYFEFTEKGQTFRYIAKPAQKTDVAGVVPISDRDAQWLLRWRPDGLLFESELYDTYSQRLKRLSQAIIGRTLTTHYGRHFAGDFIVNAGDMHLDDVKSILGIRSDEVARIYARRDIKNLLEKFYANVANMETKTD